MNIGSLSSAIVVASYNLFIFLLSYSCIYKIDVIVKVGGKNPRISEFLIAL